MLTFYNKSLFVAFSSYAVPDFFACDINSARSWQTGGVQFYSVQELSTGRVAEIGSPEKHFSALVRC